MKAADYRAKRHLLAQSYTMQDQLIADLEALESFCEGLKGVNDQQREALTSPQPAPHNVGAAIVPLVIEDLTARREFGRKKYGDELRVQNGRDALVDAYQEALDLVIYLRQKIEQDRTP